MTNLRTLMAIAVASFIAVVAFAFLNFKGLRSQRADNKLIVQFAYPVTSIDPTAYDDWESVFIGNHIYRRILPDEDKPWIPYLTNALSTRCMPEGSQQDGTCEQLRISFKPIEFDDCMGRKYSVDDIRAEFHRLLTAKAWVLPEWKTCVGAGDEVCVLAKNVPDLERRLRNVNFRFGWSKSNVKDGLFGSSTYCLKSRPEKDGTLAEGILSPRKGDDKFSVIAFHVSQDKGDRFHVALYGSKSLLTGSRQNVYAHTPLAYYVTTNASLAGYRLPWNSTATRDILSRHLIENEVFFTETPQYMRLAPEGNALRQGGQDLRSKNSLEFVLPDFLPKCRELAEALNDSWGTKSAARAVCKDIVTYVVDRVRGRKRGRWSAFLAGVSPSDPGRDAIRHQYFSPNSPESWTYDYAKPEELFYLVGMGQSLVTVDSKRVCGVKPNLLGLGDIYVTDFLPCKI